LAHLFVEECINDFLGGDETAEVQVKVVDVEEDDATAIEWRGTLEIDRRGATRSS